ncbi:MAG: SMC-Scp complex subunit ScpB [Candidatus Hydrothermarchaeales archaeon]
MDGEKLIEAALFISTEPMAIGELSRISGLKETGAKKAVKRLMRSYEEMGSALVIKRIGEDQYFMQAKDSFAAPLTDLVKPAVGQEVLKTLSIIALRQPVTQSEVVKARGHSTYQHVKELLGKEFILAEPKGRTKELCTTKKFADYFGLSHDLVELKKRVGEMMRSEPVAVEELDKVQ